MLSMATTFHKFPIWITDKQIKKEACGFCDAMLGLTIRNAVIQKSP